jgi:PiT family inorganic phosphate transporter
MHFFEALNFGEVNFVALPAIVWGLILLALFFDFLNGFHDAANSIATIVSTRVLSPQWAVIWAAFFNFVAFLIFPLSIAATMGKGIIDPAIVDNSVIAATLVAACAWDLITWYWALPTSSSHALMGGMVGAALVKVGNSALVWNGINRTLLFIVLAPLMGFVLGQAIAVAVTWIFYRATPRRVDGIFRKGQFISAGLYSLGHGGNDAQKTMGIIFVLLLAATQANSKLGFRDRFALTEQSLVELKKGPNPIPEDALTRLDPLVSLHQVFGSQKEFEAAVKPLLTDAEAQHHLKAVVKAADHAQVPTEIVLACHLAMGLGTLFGGWRIVKTMGHRLTKLRPVDGFCAELGAACTLVLTILLKVPVSTTHTITGSIVGVGSARYRFRSIRWGVAARVVWAWVFTIPASATISALCWYLIEWFK